MPTKGQETRQRIIDCALELFAKRGYHETTLRDVADAAGVSIGLAYRYFDRKEELVLALYERLSEDIARSVKLPDGTVGQRWAALERARFKLLAPHRKTLLALVQAALDPDGELGALSPATAAVRARWLELHRAVAGADDLATALYALDLLLVVLWTQDRTGKATRAAIERLAVLIDTVAALPGAAAAITELAKTFRALTQRTRS